MEGYHQEASSDLQTPHSRKASQAGALSRVGESKHIHLSEFWLQGGTLGHRVTYGLGLEGAGAYYVDDVLAATNFMSTLRRLFWTLDRW